MPGLMGGSRTARHNHRPRLGWISSRFWGGHCRGLCCPGLALRLLNYLFRRIPQEAGSHQSRAAGHAVESAVYRCPDGQPCNPPLGRFNAWLPSSWMVCRSGSHLVLGTLLGGMMATDYGGPINKAALRQRHAGTR